MRGARRIAAPLVVLLTVGLAACAPALPQTVVAGTAVTVGWTGKLTSLNAAASPTPGNIDIAEAVRGGFGDVVDGEFVPDEGFGKVGIVADDPFTVRYDLAEPKWSDGIPLDAADLLLGWAGASGLLDEEGGSAETDVETEVPVLDEFARAIEVTYAQPDIGWQQAVAAPVPAHVVGGRALGVDDPMEAKQAVIRAIRDGDQKALEKVAGVWRDAFEIPESGKLPADLLLSSGPFVVDEIDADEDGQSVTLVPNAAYAGLVTPKVARIDLVPPGGDPVAAVGDLLDVAQVVPSTLNWDRIHELERKDLLVETKDDGTLWALLLRPYGVFTQPQARVAFIHATPPSTLAERGGGVWASAYAGTTSMLSAPGTRAYDIVNEDSGFDDALGSTDDEPALEREAAGVAAGAPVCVLYDRTREFASGAFAAMREAAAEAGWSVTDCGSDDFDAAFGQGGWDAVIARVPIPQTPEQIAERWGSAGAASWHGDPDRDALIDQLAQTTDVYEAREVLAAIEASIVRAAVAMPIAVNPRVTIVDRDVTGVASRSGAVAPLTYSLEQWAAVP